MPMEKNITPFLPDSEKKSTLSGPRKSTLMLLRQIARTYGIDAASKNAKWILN